MLITLEFNLQSETSLNFIERFCQLYLVDDGLRTENGDSYKAESAQKMFSHELCSMAKYLSRYCLRESIFLDFKPSQVAAACFLLALNAISQKNQRELGSFETCSLDGEDDENEEMLGRENVIKQQMGSDDPSCVLHRWTDSICILTKLQRARDIKDAYKTLVRMLIVNGDPS